MSLHLYQFPNAICAQKVRLALAEKGLTYENHDVMTVLRSPKYLELNPSGVVPTLVHDGHVLTESRIISEYLEDAFPDLPLMPSDPVGRHRVRLWSKMVDDSLHLNIFILSFAITMRPAFLAMPDAVRAQRMPGLADPIKRSIALDLLEKGLGSTHVATARNRFVALVDLMEAALQDGPWLAGADYTLADADLTPYAVRLADIGLADLWRDAPAVTDWIARVKERPSYQVAILDWRTIGDGTGFGQVPDRATGGLEKAKTGA